MEVQINQEFPFQLTLRQAAEKLRVQEDDLEEFEELFQRCISAARPAYCFAEAMACTVDSCAEIGGLRFSSPTLRACLQSCSRAFPAIATCGRELFSLSLACSDPLVRYWADGISELLMEAAASALRQHIRRITGGRICAISPGSLQDFPLTEQAGIFRLLGDAPRAIGVELTEQFLMLPHKSTSAFYFESEAEFENCMLCPREGCMNRRMAFDAHAFAENFGAKK